MNAYRKNNAKTASTPFCKVCMDAGKGPEIYKTHYVKNDTGNVICPTLLALECRFCFKSGHTVKYCKTLEKKKQMDAKQMNRSARPEKVETKSVAPVSKNMFECLYSDDENEDDIKIEQDIPAVYQVPIVSSEKTWANIAAQEAVQIMPEEKSTSNLVSVKEILSEPKSTTEKKFTFGNCRMKNWADWSDSDDE